MRPSPIMNSALTALALAGLATSAVAGSTKAVLRTELQVPVQALVEENSATIERAFKALESKDEPPRKLLDAVTVDVEKKLVTLVIAPGQKVALSQIQRVLTAGKARLDPATLRIKEAQLVIRAAASEDDHTDALERVLRAKAAYSEVEIERETKASLYRARVKGGSERATHDGVRKVVESAAEGMSLADVIWAAPKAE